MANWKHRLAVGADRRAFEHAEITILELAQRFAVKLRALKLLGVEQSDVEERDDIADEFETVESVSEFDDVLERLYDWADTSLDNDWPRTKMCWVEPSPVGASK